MIQRNVSRLLRMVALIGVALSLIFLFVPSALASTHSTVTQSASIGPKPFYLALGDSLAYGYQPNQDFNHGYADDLYHDLENHGTSHYANMGCPSETTTSMIDGLCPLSFLRKYPYIGSQLLTAVTYLRLHPGQVSPVTLDIGANDVDLDINYSTCTISPKLISDLATMDYNLTHIILPQLTAAMTVNGRLTGDLLMMNSYNPFQNHCPNSGPLALAFNQHLAADAVGYAKIVDVFAAFGGARTPNPNICTYTWMCSDYLYLLAIHGTDLGYQVMADTFERTAGY